MWPTCIFLVALTIFPFVYSLFLSFHFVKLTSLSRRVFAGFQNYKDLFTDSLFLAGLKNSLTLAVTTITIEVIIGFMVAKIFYELAKHQWANTLRSAYLVPMMLSPIVIGAMSNYIFNPQLGIGNYLLGAAGLEPVAWFGQPVPAKLTILMMNVWQWTPFMALLLLAGLTSIRLDVLEAAKVDGAKWYHILFWIELPSILPILLLGIILRLIEILRFFDIIYVTTRGGPGDHTMVMTLYTYQQGFRYFHVGLGSASAIVILAMSIVVTTFAVKLLRRVEDDA